MLGAVAGIFLAGPVSACDLALVLAVDVSGSVSPGEYRVQMDGLALALQDPVIAEALVAAQAAVALVQWTGASRQHVTVPWRRVDSPAALDALAAEIRAAERQWWQFSTAIGEALRVSAALFEEVPDCTRRVIDVSGDGMSNEGFEPRGMRPALRAAGITVNALVIEGGGTDGLTAYFRSEVIAGPNAFAVTANGYDDYPDRIRLKLTREVVKQLSER